MQFCDSCSSAMVKVEGEWVCRTCNPERIESSGGSSDTRLPDPRPAAVSDLPTTDSGAVRKDDAMRWLSSLDEPTDRELRDAIVPKPSDFSGSTYPTAVSNIRVTGDPQFVETVAGLFGALTDLEDGRTRVEINLQQTEDRDTGEQTGNYALYLSVARRG